LAFAGLIIAFFLKETSLIDNGPINEEIIELVDKAK
jgi:uncharacterized protein YneF (UPF0154 family)